VNSIVADAMVTIGSLLDITNNILKHEFLVEQLLVPSFKVPKSKFVCEIVGLSDPWYHEKISYLKHEILPKNITSNLKRTFVKNTSHFFIIGVPKVPYYVALTLTKP
jgi:hypothetical protein